MKRPLLVLALLVTLVLHAPGQSKPIFKEDALKAIAVFREAPDSPQGQEAAATIVRFAHESANVELQLSPKLTPWLAVKPEPMHSKLLLAAYMAGSIRSQLDSGIKKHDPVAGVKQVIETYQLLQKTDPGYRVEVVERFIQQKAEEKLQFQETAH